MPPRAAPSGSPHADAMRTAQASRKRAARVALAGGDGPGCWCWLVTVEEAAHSRRQRLGRAENTGTLARLTAVNGAYYRFASETRPKKKRRQRHHLLHENEFFLGWVRSGEDADGDVVTGDVLEPTWQELSHIDLGVEE